MIQHRLDKQAMATSCFLFMVLCFCGIFLSVSGDQNNTDVIEDNSFDALRRALLMNIEKYDTPKIDNTTYTDINLSVKIHHIDIEDHQGTMNVHGFLKMKWVNQFFKWDPASFNGISNMHLFPSEIWNPQMVLMNAATSDSLLDAFHDVIGPSGILIFPNGTAVWNPPFQFQVFCSLNLRTWPYDTQKCDIKIGTWHLKDYGIKLVNDGATTDTTDHMSSLWDIMDIEASTSSDLSYDYYNIHLIVKRDSSLYNPVLHAPAFCIMLLSLCCFWLPPDSGEKVVLTCFNVFITAGFLMYFAQLLPVLGKSVPLIVLFYSVAMLMIALSIIVSVFVIRLASKDQEKHCLTRYLGIHNLSTIFKIMLCLNHVNVSKRLDEDNHNENLDPEVIDVDAYSVAAPNEEDNEFEQRFLLASCIDRIFFGIYIFVYLILIVVYSI